MQRKPIQELEHACFGRPCQRGRVKVLHTEFYARAREPFKVVEDGPAESTGHVDSYRENSISIEVAGK